MQENITLTKEKYGREHWRTGSAIESYGQFSLDRDKIAKADSLFREAHKIYSTVLERDHFWVARTEGFLTLSNRLLGNHEVADSLYKRHMAVLNDHQQNLSTNQIGRLQTLINTYKQVNGDFNFKEEIYTYQTMIPTSNDE